ncbi:MAG: alpha/beta hydrolase [Rhodospirillales bacterium]|jgi:pimeloyl-ACP methyl ester carboxylesterase|nr:alpha/beta hydrolase [Rhodospirillales bacterium]MDP6644847.1 alpha/beta hydrolase [Rhodospirillales bacterium]MDP6840421.1 alpha/beta hydrolase [Rhodospirillales bacterium]
MQRIDTESLAKLAGEDAEFRLAARLWRARIRFQIGGDQEFIVTVSDGVLTEINAAPMFWDPWDINIAGPSEGWDLLLRPVPPPLYQDIFPATLHKGFSIGGNLELLFSYFPAVRRFIELMRMVVSAPPAADPPPTRAGGSRPEIRGGYVYLTVEGTEYRVYYEEAGDGIPFFLQHTAAADGRQWRHLLEDPEITGHFRIIAPDLPYHGKSLPPESERWWETQYLLTLEFFEAFVVEFCRAMEIENPLYMGCSMGGHLAVDLALDCPDKFRAVIGLQAGMQTKPPGFEQMLEWYHHPRMSNEWKPALMYTMMAPTSPEQLRRETGFVYSQAAPMVFKGDLYFHGGQHDARETARHIDTGQIPVYIMGGDYDWSGTVDICSALAAEIKGSHYTKMEGLGHFPMCEHPEKFKSYLMPILDDVRAKHPDE